MIFTEAIRKSFLPFNFALLLSVGKIQFSSDDKKTDKIMISRKKFFFLLLGVFIMAINEIATYWHSF